MAPLLAWLESNWFPLIQCVGIIVGLAFTGISLRKSSRDSHVVSLIALTANHRELWSEAHRRKDLKRIFATEADLVGEPVTVAEAEYLNVVIAHFATGFELARTSKLVNLRDLAIDARSFFRLPAAHAVWRASKAQRSRDFVSFIDESLANN